MTVSSTPSLRGIVDMFLEGNRIHKIKSRHQAARKFLQYSTPDSVIEGSIPAFGKGCEVRSTLASLCLEAAGHSNSHFLAVFALGRGLSYDE